MQTTILSEKKYNDPLIGEIILRKKRGVRRMTVRVSPRNGVSVTLPWHVTFAQALAFVLQKRDWIIATLQRQKAAAPSEEPSEEEIESLRKEAAAYLPQRLEALAKKNGFSYGTLRLKRNRTNWGSCSGKNNINLNISLMTMPPLLRDYVMLHELCHLRHHDHSRAFHLLLEHMLTGHILAAMESGDPLAGEMARKAALSKTPFPLDSACTAAVRRYRPL